MARRLSYIQQRILAELRRNPQQSYEDLAAAIEADRSTVIVGVKILERRHHIVKERGRGPEANRYILTDRLLSL